MALRLVLVAFLVGSSLASPQAVLSKDLRSSLHEIATRSGLTNKEVASLASLSDPKSQILDKLNDLLTQLRTDQNEAETTHEIFVAAKAQERANLQATLDAVKQQIQDLNNQINQNQGNIGSLSSQESELQQQADDADAQIKLYEAMLDRLNQDHTTAVARYADIIQRHDDSLATLQQLIDMVSNFQFQDALALLKKQHHKFLHRRTAHIALLVESTIQLIQTEGPKNEIKQKLLDLLNQIKQGTLDSRALYVEEAQNEVSQFNDESVNLNNIINNFVAQRDSALAQLADIRAQKAQEQSQLQDSQGSLDNLQESLSNIGDSISALDAEIAQEDQTFKAQTQDRIDDMNAVEAAIQYVNEHVQGMSVHDLCHIGSTGCYRCLTSDDCGQGEECSDDGKCEPKPQPVLLGGTVSEHASLNLACDNGKTIREVRFASYGMPTGEFPTFAINGWCNAPSSQGIIASMCLGQQSCLIRAENDVFGDPCYGTFKHLSVLAVCE